MNCEQARQRWHDSVDELREDEQLRRHLEACEACRAYASEMELIVGVLDTLRRETETIVSGTRVRHTGTARSSKRRLFSRMAVGLAAALAVAITGLSYYTPDRAIEGSRVGTPLDVALTPDAPEPPLGLSLRGGFADRYLVVPAPVADDNVQMFWLYPIVAGDGESTGS